MKHIEEVTDLPVFCETPEAAIVRCNESKPRPALLTVATFGGGMRYVLSGDNSGNPCERLWDPVAAPWLSRFRRKFSRQVICQLLGITGVLIYNGRRHCLGGSRLRSHRNGL